MISTYPGRVVPWINFYGSEIRQGIVLGFDFCPHSIINVTWNPESPLPPVARCQANRDVRKRDGCPGRYLSTFLLDIYVPLVSPNPYPIIVYSVANYYPVLVTFG